MKKQMAKSMDKMMRAHMMPDGSMMKGEKHGKPKGKRKGK